MSLRPNASERDNIRVETCSLIDLDRFRHDFSNLNV